MQLAGAVPLELWRVGFLHLKKMLILKVLKLDVLVGRSLPFKKHSKQKKMIKNSFLLLSFLIVGLNVHAQGIYRWQDENGKTVYGDNPPNQQILEQLDAPPIQEPYRPKAVTLYVTSNCEVCEAARYFLEGHRISFTTYTIETAQDLAEFKKRGGTQELPALSIEGAQMVSGFDAVKWNQAIKNNSLRQIIYKPAKRLPNQKQ